MTATLVNITFDCEDAATIASFWSAVLGRPVEDGANGYFASLAAEGGGPRWLFLKVPEPRTTKNRVHVDLATPDRRAEVERLVGLGATEVGEHDEYGIRWSVLTDPEGNEFCVAQRNGAT